MTGCPGLGVVIESPSFDQHWQAFVDMAPPVANAVATLPAHEAKQIRDAAAESLGPYLQDGVVRVPARAVGATGRR